MNGTYQKIIILVTCVIGTLVALPFVGRLANRPTEANTTIPLGLFLEETESGLKVIDAMDEASEYSVRVGDLIQSVDGKSVNSIVDFRAALLAKSIGERLVLKLERDSAEVSVNCDFRGEIEIPFKLKSAAKTTTTRNVRASTTANKTSTSSQQVATAKTSEKASEPSSTEAALNLPPLHSTGSNSIAPAEFGFRLEEAAGKVFVRKVVENRSADAYGVKQGDVLFEIDSQKVTSLNDFHRVAGKKFAGDTVNLMLIRNEEIVLIENMAIHAAGQEVTRPAQAYSPVIHPFASLKKEALERITASPFDGPPELIATNLETVPTSEDPAAEISTKLAAVPDLEELNALIGARPFADGMSNLPLTSNLEPHSDDTQPLRTDTFIIPNIDTATPMEQSATAPTADNEFLQGIAESPLPLRKPNARPRFSEHAKVEVPRQTPTKSNIAEQAEAAASPEVITGEAEFAQELEISGEVAASPSDRAQSTSDDVDPVKTEEELPYPDTEFSQSSPAPMTPLNNLGATMTNGQSIPQAPVPQEAGQLNQPAPIVHGSPTPYLDGPTYAKNNANDSVIGLGQPCSACGSGGCDQCQGKCDDSRFSLDRLLHGNCSPSVSMGGWISTGYHSAGNDLFNNRPNKVALHQAWLYAEKGATEDSPIGFRADFMYGIDAADTQAFGNNAGEWDFDNGLDHGSYGWAIPQAYLEVALGDWRIMAGHFFTLVGYEVVTAPDNFFYSHAMTMYNSEPFTHTGVLASRSIGDQLEIYGGWTLGWDTGFDQFENGGSWIGGFSYSVSEDIKFTQISTTGDFGVRGDDGSSYSLVLDLTLTDRLNLVTQSDYLRVASTGEDNVGLNQYLLYTLNDQIGIGARMEWWKGDVLTGYAPHGGVLPAAGSLSYYAATLGVNYSPVQNLTLRPEVRHDWSPVAGYDETYFGMDAIVSF